MSKAEKTRQYIVEKTAPVFNIKGYAGTSLTDMTEATGLTKGSIYGNFEDKDEVALAAFDYNFGCIQENVRAIQSTAKTALGKIKAYTTYYDGLMKDTLFKGGCPLINTGTEADDTHPALKEKVKTAINGWKKSLEKLVKEAIEDGDMKKSTDPAEFAATMIMLVEGGILMTKITGNTQFMKLALQQLDKHIESRSKK